LLALQGPKAEAVLAGLNSDCTSMRFMEARAVKLLGADCIVTRSGYTGEDGFEISMPADIAREVAEELLANESVAPIGLGARDTLRLEAGLCLYGSDIDQGTTPVEAGLAWAIPRVRRQGGAREGGFPGADTILAQIEQGAPRRRVGLKPEGRAPVRADARLFADENATAPVGLVTSGGFSPSLNTPIAMGYVPAALSAPGTRIYAELHGKRVPVTVATLPFIAPHYKRG